MNFNFSNKAEYDLNTSLATEMINLYGVLTKFMIVEKINTDDAVFGDYSHLKSDANKIYDIYMLPENTEEWDSTDYSFTNFGLVNFENITLFAARSNFDNIVDLTKIVGNLIVLPNNKVMEITDVDPTVPGVNNLFTYNDAKAIYKLVCKPYSFKLINELDNEDISVDPEVPYDTLDTYFNELIDQAAAQDTEAEVTEQVTTVDQGEVLDTKVIKPIIDKTEDDVWGQY